MIKVRLTKNKKEVNEVLKIREKVFIKGQNVPKEREIDGLDSSSKHIILFYNDKPAGCARLRFIKAYIKLERIAILKKYRSKGLGRPLMEYLINYSKKKEANKIILESQCYIQKFYEHFGFKPLGRIFMDANIKHIKMEKRL